MMADNWTQGVLFDCETSGTDPQRHQILTLDATVIRRGLIAWEAVKEPFHGDLERQPGKLWDKGAVEVNRIDINTWTGETAHTLVDRLVRWVRNAAGDGYQLVFGYNVGFDVDFLKALFTDAGARWTDAFSYRRMDVLQLVQWSRLTGRLQVPANSLRLVDVAGALGIATDDAHNSAADVKITLDLMNRLLLERAQGNLFD